MKLKEVLKDLGNKFDCRIRFIYIKKSESLVSILGIIISLIIFLFSDIIIYIIFYITYFIFMIIIINLLKIRYKPIYMWVEIDPDEVSEFVEGFFELSGESMNGFRFSEVDAAGYTLETPNYHLMNRYFPEDQYGEMLHGILTIDSLCSICESKLHNSFPKDFPDKYRICCLCLNTAIYIYQKKDKKKEKREKREINTLEDFIMMEMGIISRKNIGLENRYNKHKEKFDNLFIIKKKGVVI